MRRLSFFLFLFAIPLLIHAQRSLSGLWSGTISNDSVTIRKDQSFEIALTQYKEKIYGYTRSSFIVNDTLYYIVKRVKGTIKDDLCEIKDDEIVSSNFPGKIDKGVKVTTQFRMNREDSSWYLAGNWNTNTVKKKYYAITGKVRLKEETDFNASRLVPHLEELKLANELDFYKEKMKPAKTESIASNMPPNLPVKNKTPASVSKKKEKVVETKPIQPTIADKPKTDPVVVVEEKKQATPVAVAAAAAVAERKVVAPQIVSFKSDSLQLALYDNGEIDGDTVSVLLNGEIILAKQALKASAIRKTIYIQPGTDELTLVLYAENLGKYPPNTGLLVVNDGDDVIQVRFSADLQQNAAVIFKRKK